MGYLEYNTKNLGLLGCKKTLSGSDLHHSALVILQECGSLKPCITVTICFIIEYFFGKRTPCHFIIAAIVCMPSTLKQPSLFQQRENRVAKMNNSIETARERLKTSRKVVFFGGAGVSTASGIPDFRSATGLYNQMTGSHYLPETMLSHNFFANHPDEFYTFLRSSLYYPDAKPNAAHYVLAKMEENGKLNAVITQNIDGLHQQGGSKVVYELHGSLKRFYCMRCHRAYQAERVYSQETTPYCEVCGGLVRPDVVLYGEPLDPDVLNASISAVRKADCMIVGGSSLVVYPAAGLLDYFRGGCLILINREPTPYDSQADFVFHGDIGEVLIEISPND